MHGGPRPLQRASVRPGGPAIIARMGDGDAGDELVFVSYSHADAAWVQRFTVLLKPLLRTRRLRLWADTSLRGGDAWRPEIEAAIARSTAALLLVSGDFLASELRHGSRAARARPAGGAPPAGAGRRVPVAGGTGTPGPAVGRAAGSPSGSGWTPCRGSHVPASWRVVSGGRVHLWLPSDDTVDVLGEPTSVVTTVAWSGTGDRLAGGPFDVRVWGPVEARWGVARQSHRSGHRHGVGARR